MKKKKTIIIGAVVGSVVLVAAAVIATIFAVAKKKNSKEMSGGFEGDVQPSVMAITSMAGNKILFMMMILTIQEIRLRTW